MTLSFPPKSAEEVEAEHLQWAKSLPPGGTFHLRRRRPVQAEDPETSVTTGDILGPSEAMRSGLDYWAHASSTGPTLERLASLQPTTLACMHGSAWTGDGAGLIRELAARLEVGEPAAAR